MHATSHVDDLPGKQLIGHAEVHLFPATTQTGLADAKFPRACQVGAKGLHVRRKCALSLTMAASMLVCTLEYQKWG